MTAKDIDLGRIQFGIPQHGVGTAVSAGQCVIMLEAMKMEVEVVADVAGTVKSINVKKGDAVTTGQALAVVG